MITICKCQYCGREFEAKRSDATICSDPACRHARWREYAHNRRPRPLPVYNLKCRVCGKSFKATYKQTQYCSPHCRNVAAGPYHPKPTVGFSDSDTKRISRRRQEVLARMRFFARFDGMRH